ncbi:hypothetical protein XENTR_v10022381 [Xenopus tropicalis]|nr:hypothetical protein XENTR_v10022381 [Xenopus tropicalis]
MVRESLLPLLISLGSETTERAVLLCLSQRQESYCAAVSLTDMKHSLLLPLLLLLFILQFFPGNCEVEETTTFYYQSSDFYDDFEIIYHVPVSAL